jgi:hypothetical protein
MSKINEEQKVKLFSDEDSIGIQEVHIDTEDPCGPWINVIHNGAEISLSLENWNKLVELVKKAELKAVK